MGSKGFRVFAHRRATQFKDEATSKGLPLPADLLSRVLVEWNALPDRIRAMCEAQALAQEARLTVINGERSFPQHSLRDPPHSSSKRESSMESMAGPAVARLTSTQHASFSSPSTTPSPSTPALSPSPLCSPRQISYPNVSMGVPASSQPEPLNTGDHWSGIRYGTAPEVKFLVENHPSQSQGGRQTAAKQVPRSHPYTPTSTSVLMPHLHASQMQSAYTAPLRRSQTVVLTPSTQTTTSVAGVPSPDANVVRRFKSVPSVVASSKTENAPHEVMPVVNNAPITYTGKQVPHSSSLDHRSSFLAVEGDLAVPVGARQPPPSSSHAGIGPHVSPVQTLTPILEETRAYTPWEVTHHVQVTPAQAAAPLASSFDPTPHQVAWMTTAPIELCSPAGMELLRNVPTPVPDVFDVDAFLDVILAPQFPTPQSQEVGISTEDNPLLPDISTPSSWPEDARDWVNGSYPTGWEHFNAFKEA